MNERLYEAAARLTPRRELAADRGAFFGSILGTLNPLLADTVWLHRFAAPAYCAAALAETPSLARPARLREPLAADLLVSGPTASVWTPSCCAGPRDHHRRALDATLSYTSMAGVFARRPSATR